MSFIINEEKPKKRIHRDVVKLVTPSRVDITNGSVAHMAYPQFYIEEKMPKKANPQPPQSRKELIKLWERCIYWDKKHRWCCHPNMNHCHHDKCISCHRYLDLSLLIPTHLRREYPTSGQYILSADVHLEKDSNNNPVLPGLSASATVDAEPFDYIIRATFTANCESAQTKPQYSRFSLVLSYNKPGDIMKSVAVNGIVKVWPGII